jgi:hypothetical protein
MEAFFETCFASFDDLGRQYAASRRDGIATFVSAAGTEINFGHRPKRFAGGPGLPVGRYFTVCEDHGFGDGGTLRDELTAYYSGKSGVTVTVFDPKVDPGILDYLQESHGASDESLAHPLYLFIYKIERRTEMNLSLINRDDAYPQGEAIAFTYGVREIDAVIDDVIDLRLPETQEWFVRTFVNLELAGRERAEKETGLVILRVDDRPWTPSVTCCPRSSASRPVEA